jgi:hypothetical protein
MDRPEGHLAPVRHLARPRAGQSLVVHRGMRSLLSRVGVPTAVLATAGTLACGSMGGGAAEPAGGALPAPAAAAWPIKTREHADLWLHGYAMLQDDTTRIPYFRRGYRDRMVVRRNQASATSELDANRERLRVRLATNPALVNGQFIPLFFESWDELRQSIDLFIRADGDPRRASNQQVQRAIALLASYFPTTPDRTWLELFVRSLTDESAKFYHGYWVQEQQNRRSTLDAVDNLWRTTYRPKLQRFLNNTQQEGGDIFLALPLDGEGRTITLGSRENAVAVEFPDQPSVAVEAIYVVAHEIVGNVANGVVRDNTTPAEQRGGVLDRYASHALVRGGALLLEKIAPDLVDGYARFYLRAANLPSSAGDPRAALAAAFPLPEAIVQGISRQLDVVLGGI